MRDPKSFKRIRDRLADRRVARRDPANDGPEVELIRFFRWHPYGTISGVSKCRHVADYCSIMGEPQRPQR